MHAYLNNGSKTVLQNTYISPASHPKKQSWNQMNAKTKNVYPMRIICIFMKINENIRNERKRRRKVKMCAYNITYISASNYSRLPHLVLNHC